MSIRVPFFPSTRSGLFRRALGDWGAVLGRQRVDDLDCLDADADDLADEADDVFFVVGVIGVAGDAAALVGADLVLVDDAIERAAVAEAVLDVLANVRKTKFAMAYANCRKITSRLWNALDSGYNA